MMTVNLRELIHIACLRMRTEAQWEIREVARRMLEEVRKVAPTLFESAGPRCEQLGYCPEPAGMSCGRFPPKEEVLRASKAKGKEEGEG